MATVAAAAAEYVTDHSIAEHFAGWYCYYTVHNEKRGLRTGCQFQSDELKEMKNSVLVVQRLMEQVYRVVFEKSFVGGFDW
jgi:hypothetical protein